MSKRIKITEADVREIVRQEIVARRINNVVSEGVINEASLTDLIQSIGSAAKSASTSIADTTSASIKDVSSDVARVALSAIHDLANTAAKSAQSVSTIAQKTISPDSRAAYNKILGTTISQVKQPIALAVQTATAEGLRANMSPSEIQALITTAVLSAIASVDD